MQQSRSASSQSLDLPPPRPPRRKSSSTPIGEEHRDRPDALRRSSQGGGDDEHRGGWRRERSVSSGSSEEPANLSRPTISRRIPSIPSSPVPSNLYPRGPNQPSPAPTLRPSPSPPLTIKHQDDASRIASERRQSDLLPRGAQEKDKEQEREKEDEDEELRPPASSLFVEGRHSWISENSTAAPLTTTPSIPDEADLPGTQPFRMEEPDFVPLSSGSYSPPSPSSPSSPTTDLDRTLHGHPSSSGLPLDQRSSDLTTIAEERSSRMSGSVRSRSLALTLNSLVGIVEASSGVPSKRGSGGGENEADKGGGRGANGWEWEMGEGDERRLVNVGPGHHDRQGSGDSRGSASETRGVALGRKGQTVSSNLPLDGVSHPPHRRSSSTTSDPPNPPHAAKEFPPTPPPSGFRSPTASNTRPNARSSEADETTLTPAARIAAQYAKQTRDHLPLSPQPASSPFPPEVSSPSATPTTTRQPDLVDPAPSLLRAVPSAYSSQPKPPSPARTNENDISSVSLTPNPSSSTATLQPPSHPSSDQSSPSPYQQQQQQQRSSSSIDSKSQRQHHPTSSAYSHDPASSSVRSFTSAQSTALFASALLATQSVSSPSDVSTAWTSLYPSMGRQPGASINSSTRTFQPAPAASFHSSVAPSSSGSANAIPLRQQQQQQQLQQTSHLPPLDLNDPSSLLSRAQVFSQAADLLTAESHALGAQALQVLLAQQLQLTSSQSAMSAARSALEQEQAKHQNERSKLVEDRKEQGRKLERERGEVLRERLAMREAKEGFEGERRKWQREIIEAKDREMAIRLEREEREAQQATPLTNGGNDVNDSRSDASLARLPGSPRIPVATNGTTTSRSAKRNSLPATSSTSTPSSPSFPSYPTAQAQHRKAESDVSHAAATSSSASPSAYNLRDRELAEKEREKEKGASVGKKSRWFGLRRNSDTSAGGPPNGLKAGRK